SSARAPCVRLGLEGPTRVESCIIRARFPFSGPRLIARRSRLALMLTLPGAPALSDFRTARLLASIRAREAGVQALRSQFIHFVQTRRELTADERRVLDALLTYGPKLSERAVDPISKSSRIVVVPRPGTISPWSSKATDIAHVCGLDAIERIERGIAYELLAEGELTQDALREIAPVLYDRMTE